MVLTPVTFTDVSLAQFMVDALGQMAVVLEKTSTASPGPYDEAIISVILAYGNDATTTADLLDIEKTRALARREAWRLAWHDTSVNYNYAVAGEAYARAEQHRFATEMYNFYYNEALPYDESANAAYQVRIVDLIYPYDNYEPIGAWSEWAS